MVSYISLKLLLTFAFLFLACHCITPGLDKNSRYYDVVVWVGVLSFFGILGILTAGLVLIWVM